jgi:predicted ester cyclase
MGKQKCMAVKLTSLLMAGVFIFTVPAISFAQQTGGTTMKTTPQQAAKPEELANLVRAYYQAIETRPLNVSQVSSFFDDEYRNYPPRKAPPGVSVKDATLNLLKNLSDGFPDAKRTLVMVEPLSDDRVLAYFSFSGAHTGQFFTHPATGNKVSFIGVDIFKIKNNKFVENHHVEDLTTLFEQLKAKAN